jgi:hypothetical protein
LSSYIEEDGVQAMQEEELSYEEFCSAASEALQATGAASALAGSQAAFDAASRALYDAAPPGGWHATDAPRIKAVLSNESCLAGLLWSAGGATDGGAGAAWPLLLRGPLIARSPGIDLSNLPSPSLLHPASAGPDNTNNNINEETEEAVGRRRDAVLGRITGGTLRVVWDVLAGTLRGLPSGGADYGAKKLPHPEKG